MVQCQGVIKFQEENKQSEGMETGVCAVYIRCPGKASLKPGHLS